MSHADGLVKYSGADGESSWGVAHERWVTPVTNTQAASWLLSGKYLPSGENALADDLSFLPPLFPNARVFCVGLNYDKHIAETQRDTPKHPVLFSRTHESFVGPHADIICPRESEQLDYEGELAIVIGKPGRRITESAALEHIAGFTLANDATLRDWQFHTHQYFPGKNFDASGALGPAIWPASSLNFNEAVLQTHVAGELMQSAALCEMIFSPSHLIAYLSTFTALRTGDVILTGTPGGIGAKRSPPRYLRLGEQVIISIGLHPPLINQVSISS